MSDFYVTINDPERAAEFEEILGTTTLPVKSLTPVKDGSCKVFYIVDTNLLTDKQQVDLIWHVAKKFSARLTDVAEELDKNGLPVLAEHCSIVIANPQRWT